MEEYVAEVNRSNKAAAVQRSTLQAELARVDRQITTMVRTIADTGGSRAVIAELRTLEQRQDQLQAKIAAADKAEPTPALHPNLSKVYR